MNFQQNFMNSLTGGLQFGQQLKAQRDTTQINQLAGQAYSAEPEQRESLLAQMQQINPTMAAEQEKALGMTDERRQKGLINAARILVNTPEQFRAGQYARMVPGLSRYGLSALPPEYNAETSGLIMETAQGLVRAADGTAGTPTDVRSFQMMTAGMSPEDVERARRINLGLDGRASSSGFSQVKFTGADGRERIGVLNGKTGQIDLPDGTSFNPQTGAISATPSAQQGTVFTTSEGGQFDVSQVQDPHLRQQILQNPEAWGMAPSGSTATLPQRVIQGQTGAGSTFVGRAPEDQAAATERAKLQAQAEYLPQELGMRSQAAVDQAVGIERGKAGVERDQMAATRQRDAGTALDLLGEAERLLPQATGGRIGAVGDAVAGAFGVSTDGARANAALATIAGQLTSKMPRMEGPQSDRDVQMYKEMAGDLANANLPIETRLAALQQIRRLQSKYAGGQRQQPPVMVNSPAEYNALPAGALYTAPDGSTRRKK